MKKRNKINIWIEKEYAVPHIDCPLRKSLVELLFCRKCEWFVEEHKRYVICDLNEKYIECDYNE